MSDPGSKLAEAVRRVHSELCRKLLFGSGPTDRLIGYEEVSAKLESALRDYDAATPQVEVVRERECIKVCPDCHSIFPVDFGECESCDSPEHGLVTYRLVAQAEAQPAPQGDLAEKWEEEARSLDECMRQSCSATERLLFGARAKALRDNAVELRAYLAAHDIAVWNEAVAMFGQLIEEASKEAYTHGLSWGELKTKVSSLRRPVSGEAPARQTHAYLPDTQSCSCGWVAKHGEYLPRYQWQRHIETKTSADSKEKP